MALELHERPTAAECEVAAALTSLVLLTARTGDNVRDAGHTVNFATLPTIAQRRVTAVLLLSLVQARAQANHMLSAAVNSALEELAQSTVDEQVAYFLRAGCVGWQCWAPTRTSDS